MSGVWWGAAGRYADVSLATLDFSSGAGCPLAAEEERCPSLEYEPFNHGYIAPDPCPNMELAPPPFAEPRTDGETPPRIQMLEHDLLLPPVDHQTPEAVGPFDGDAYSWRVEVTPGAVAAPDDETAAEEAEERDEAN
jgi:hypothetical protein